MTKAAQQPNKEANATDETQKPNNPNIVVLKHRFKTGLGVELKQLEVKPITVRLMKQAQRRGGDDQGEVETASVAFACDLLPEDLDDMHMIDYFAVRERFLQLNQGS